MRPEPHAFDRSRVYPLGDYPRRAPRQDIISGFLARGETAMLSGQPGHGKTALACLMAKCVSEGSSFLGVPTTAGDVVFIAAEKDTATCLRLMALGAPLKSTFLRGDPVMLDDPASVDHAIAAIRAATGAPILIIVDTLAKCMGGLDESSNRDASRAMAQLQRILEAFPSAALLVLHHLTKADQSLRGASAILGAIDMEWRVSRRKNFHAVEVVKSNNTPEGRTLNFQLRPINTNHVEVIAAHPVEPVAPAGPKQPGRQAMQLLAMIPEGETPRSDVLRWARERAIFNSSTPASQSARVKQLLDELQGAGEITFTSAMVSRPSLSRSDPKEA
jgi:KaiC/GvpD/RAD55 family RecA-like ATPase